MWDEALGLVIERLEAAWLPAHLVPDPEFHAYEPLRADQFQEMLEVAIVEAPGDRYLEVGCGIGTKLILAAMAGLDVTGIEHRPNYLAVARYLLDQPPQPFDPPTLELADARFYGNYAAFDIVYAYRPIVAEAGQVEFEAMLSREMRPGAVLMNPCRPQISPEWIATEHQWVWRR